MILLFVIVLFVGTFFIRVKEGLEDDYLSLAIHAIKSAQRDSRMSPKQQIALQDALSYAKYIKHTTGISKSSS
jgi:hypothetical protein